MKDFFITSSECHAGYYALNAPAVETLDVGEDTLPVRLLVLYHVLHVQERVDVGQLPAHK